ncbi:hypothetical protein DYB37_002486 [Aphanomyces astaci]|uniref:glucan endo-1,3-beta-D-glucosidase n=3 Tax=Aphanomyces astaci TaxID=112090 RepID=A0A397AWP4_APHAT|nr:hypothetical protein DYB36_000062 [Aphanomyces astaci]RHY64520.1 hypothetical protein DYB38_000633 [Aphanomyces astaci]RHY96399.1 hypothetical protein DYB35_001068 [Aphanomyces astaci]RHZ18801.1 hypothetical protein DYB26_002717 [Aphanomyces astaci]RHZ24396.1 hypothetical protein DYB37_002486 [Aphanomyces astaci]
MRNAPSLDLAIPQSISTMAHLFALISVASIVAVSAQTPNSTAPNATTPPTILYDTPPSFALPTVDMLASPLAMFDKSTAQSWLAPPRNLHPSITADMPIPTNRWWGNLISTGKDAKEVLRVWTNPYAVAMLPTGIQVSYPASTRAFGGSSGNGAASRYYLHAAQNDVTLSAVELVSQAAESTSPSNFQVTAWDDLGVTVRKDVGGAAASMTTSLTSGMAFATATYVSLKPRLFTEHAIRSVNGQVLKEGQSVSASKFIVALGNGQTWVVYTSTEVTFTAHLTTQLVSPTTFSGTLQVALAPTAGDVAVYDMYRDCAVKGGSVLPDTTSYTFQWATTGKCANGLLHFGLSHHADTIDRTSTRHVNMTHLQSTTRGAMIPFVSTSGSWKLVEPKLVSAGFYPRQRPTAARVKATDMLRHLTADINAPWSLPLDGSYYFNGKAAQKYASLCLMASDAAVVGSSTSSLLDTCRAKMDKLLAPLASNGWTYKLVYDSVYKGIVSSQGFAQKDLNADFGNTMYNDHHYHFGYWIATVAIANVVHPTMPSLPKLNQLAALLVRDVANDNAKDTAFPTFRMFDWFRGHSYSHGVTALADGKDQESTSEDVNFHYGLLLFGQAIKNPNLERLGRLMLSVNARSVQTYFLMDSANRIHPPSIRANKVTGIFFDNKVDYATWFSAERHCIHGIQMIPVSPATEFVRTARFVQEEWTDILAHTAIVKQNTGTNPWLSLLYANYAAINPDVAMDKLQTIAMDDGLTRSWALYMAASRYTDSNA